uniref:Uncharacterized protein n=1 Tax=Malurus cyaneus samueli TaxID=2593467 RepID=A0A8C5U123_9PASS
AGVHPESILGQINSISGAFLGGTRCKESISRAGEAAVEGLDRRWCSVPRFVLRSHICAPITDVSKPEDVQRMVDAIVARWGTVHIACNNAGINLNSASEDTSLEEWDKTFNVNLRGLFLCCQVSAAGRIMLNQGYGKIINTASMASLIGE